MAKFRAVYIYILTAMLAGSAHAKINIYSMLELAAESDVIFVGKTVSVGKASAEVSLEYVLKGGLGQKIITVSPITFTHCLGETVHFKKDEAVLIFGRKSGKGAVTVLGGGQGRVLLKPETRDEQLVAASWVAALATYGEDEQIKTMVAEINNENKFIRDEVSKTIPRIPLKLVEKHKETFLRLINDDDPNLQAAGLGALYRLKLDGLIPRLSELMLSDNLSVAYAAVGGLAEYNTPESIAELGKGIAHKHPRLRGEIAHRLLISRRPEAKPLLERLLKDDDEMVRNMVKSRLAKREGE